jgi:serine/threonine-protein kinase
VFQPTTFGKYFLTRRIAIGGMAEVFQAKLFGADGFEKDLVIKQILPQYAKDPEFVQSFVAEAKIAVTLNHANVVGIYELGRVDGTYFIAMEYVDGLDVFTLIDAARRHEKEIPIGWSALVVEEVAKGLDYAHRKVGPDGRPLGLVHRDLNPRNVLISTEGEVKILDFGIAKTASTVAQMPKTRAGVVKGTTGYMSPEQATGRDVDLRTDIYQAGLLLFEMLTGVALFWRPDDEETRENMRRHRIVPPSTLVAGVPKELDEIVLRCLERSPAARYPSAAELASAIGRVRFNAYPDANHRAIGELVGELGRKEAQQEQLNVQALPSTQELSAVISRAIEHSITAEVETIAMRAPSGIVAPKMPTTGSTPLVVAEATAHAVLPPPPEAPPAEVKIESVPDEETIDPPLSGPKPRPARPWLAIAAAAAVGAGALIAWPRAPGPDPRPPPVAASVDGGAVVAMADPPVAPTPPEAVIAPSPDASIVEPPPPPEPAKGNAKRPADKRPKRPKPRAAVEEAFGTVSFGTRSCSSQVTVDGQVVTRSTPFYGHRLPAGPHRVIIEGTSCAPIEQPGSLRRTIPQVAATVRVEAGASIKVIADFDSEELIVKPD